MADENPAAKSGSDTFSQLLARVFEQLSVSAWLPALICVAPTLVVAQLCANGGAVDGAFRAISAMGGVDVVLLVAAVVVLAVFTQAFEFAGIRFLEGYWRVDGPLEGLRARRCAHWRGIRADLVARRGEAGDAAVASARPQLLNWKVPELEVDFLRVLVADAPKPRPPVVEGDDVATANEAARYARASIGARGRVTAFKTAGSADLVARWQLLDRALDEYPASPYRVLPTRLGNIIRAAEDRNADPKFGRLEVASMQILDRVAPSVRDAYFQQRRRLNLYCGLVFVFGAAILPVIGAVVLWCRDVPSTVAAVPAVVLIAWGVSYRAALASARLFGLSLAALAVQRRLIAPAG